MNNLLLFLQKYYYWFVFLILEIVSLGLLFQYNNYQGSVYFTSANVMSGYIHEVQSRIASYFSLQQVNEDLTQQNVRLAMELSDLRERLIMPEDSTNYAPSVKSTLAEYPPLPAVVVNVTLNRKNNFLTINKGEADGVKPEMGVLGGNGLVGVVYKTTAHYSLVMPLINTSSNISCRIRNRGYFGYLRWNAEDSRYAMLEDVPRHATFKKGDLVETSGFSEMFPQGVFVGRIDEIYDSPDGLSYQLKVR
jgi:rod shape-determining protein MreC